MYGYTYPVYGPGYASGYGYGNNGCEWLWIIIVVFIVFFLFCNNKNDRYDYSSRR